MLDSSDIELRSALPKKTSKKLLESPTTEMLKQKDPKKITTKEMIHKALIDLKSRKGTSLHAIKKYIEEKYQVDVEKINHIIKKYLKTSVEMGTIVQTKGVGANGSFKLAAGKDKLEKKKKMLKKDERAKISDKSEKPKLQKTAKLKTTKEMETEKNGQKKPKKVEISKNAKNNEVEKKPATSKRNQKKEMSGKSSKSFETPKKKRAAIKKRKSIGSILKPPKMKPTAKA
ncbi:unnamed protein product, partial [Brenthis ino]